MKKHYILSAFFLLYFISINYSFAQTTDVVTELKSPYVLAFKGNDLYISEFNDNKISKIDITTLSTNESISKSRIQLYPNPSNEFIQVSNITTNKSYKIYNGLGKEIKSGLISNIEQIDIRSFTNGLYFFKFDDGTTIKFLKE